MAELLLLAVLLAAGQVRAQTNPEAAALLRIKSGFTNGDTILADWNSSETSPCGWKAVSCDPATYKFVTTLYLNQLGLTGTLVLDGWDQLTRLEILHLWGNELTGTLPPLALPASLREFVLSGNKVQGSPTTTQWPSSLKVLDLSQNRLAGTLAPGAWLPPALEYFHIDGNEINGTIPAALALLDSLLELGLSNNKLTGSLPARLPSSLKLLALHECGLTGSIPPDLVLPSKLEQFRVWANSLTGAVPPIALPSSLVELTLDSNKFTSIPDSWQLPPRLQVLTVQNNQLSGELSRQLPQLPSTLTLLDLGFNKLSGTLPTNWTLPDLETASVQYNRLTGTLPAWQAPATARIMVLPQDSAGFCGEVPAATPYYGASDTDPSGRARLAAGSLPSCGTTAGSPAPAPASPGGSAGPTAVASPLPASPAPSPAAAGGSGGSSSTGLIIGAVAGCAAAAILVAAGVWWWRRRARRSAALGMLKPANSPEASSMAPESSIPSSKPADEVSPGGDSVTEHHVLEVKDERPDSSHLVSGAAEAAPAALIAAPLLPVGSSRVRPPAVDVKPWTVNYAELEFKRQIGQGAYGQVWLASWRGADVAVKLLGDPAVASAGGTSSWGAVLQGLQQEAQTMAGLRHPHVVSFLGLCTQPPLIVSECCPRGSLFDILREARASEPALRALDWPRRLQLALGAASGMLHLALQDPPLVHRDLKSPNILIDKAWNAKVADFNLSKLQLPGDAPGPAGGGATSVAVTNPRWLAPEVLAGERATLESDVFSYGVVLWEMLSFELPFADSTSPWQVAKFVIGGGRLAIPERAQLPDQGMAPGLDAYIELIHRCWVQEPAQRPPFHIIVSQLREILIHARQPGAGSGEC